MHLGDNKEEKASLESERKKFIYKASKKKIVTQKV